MGWQKQGTPGSGDVPLLENHPAINRHTQRALHDTQTATHDTADSAVVDAECSFLLQKGRPVQSDSDWAAWTSREGNAAAQPDPSPAFPSASFQ